MLINLGEGDHSESEMKLNIYVPIINVGTLMSIGNDRQSRGHDLHRNSMGNMFICFRTSERTLTIFGRNFPNEVWHSSHMTSDILMVTI